MLNVSDRALNRTAGFASLAFCCAAFTAAAEPGHDQQFDLPHPSGIEISNGKSGVVCLEGGEPSHVCEEAYTINIVGHPSYHTYGPVEQETAVTSIHACSVDGAPLYQVSFRAFYEPE